MQTVWLIDDEELLCEISAAALSADFRTECFSSAQAVLQALDGGRAPDVFVSDIRMPGMTGIQLVSELRRRGIDKPILIISGFTDKEIAVEALSLGVFALIEKPFHPNQFLHTVQRASAYGELLQMTEDLIKNYQELLGSMGGLVGLCRDRYIAAENQLGTPVPEGDREKVLKYMKSVVQETRLEEVTERTTRNIHQVLARRKRLKAAVGTRA